jgi:hypothetical protein
MNPSFRLGWAACRDDAQVEIDRLTALIEAMQTLKPVAAPCADLQGEQDLQTPAPAVVTTATNDEKARVARIANRCTYQGGPGTP